MLIFFGWGRKSKSWSFIDEDQTPKAILCVYDYFDMFFFFKLVVRKKWYIVTENRSEDEEISFKELQEMTPGYTPQLSVWEAYGLLILAGMVGSFILFSSL
jgi:hypothetical protein